MRSPQLASVARPSSVAIEGHGIAAELHAVGIQSSGVIKRANKRAGTGAVLRMTRLAEESAEHSP